MNKMQILVTGSNGFIGSNLIFHLNQLSNYKVVRFDRKKDVVNLQSILKNIDVVIHLAGVNRPKNKKDFVTGNLKLTELLCSGIAESGRKILLVLASSIQAELNNDYGKSKYSAEIATKNLSKKFDIPVLIFRLPGVFGKWCKPNYNSVVATFCYNTARNIKNKVHDPNHILRLVYIDDVISKIICSLNNINVGIREVYVSPEYSITVGQLENKIKNLHDSRKLLITERTGNGLIRALYATYISYLPADEFTYDIPVYKDARGIFVEILKTPDCGQFSFFSAHPGITRGGHYHHTKSEKFLVIKGQALFKFRNLITNELHQIRASSNEPVIIDTIPGWSHNVTNVGKEEMFVVVWANENFDKNKPDTINSKV